MLLTAKKNNFEKAIDDFNTVIELQTNNAEGYRIRGVSLWCHRRNLTKALPTLTQAIKAQP